MNQQIIRAVFVSIMLTLLVVPGNGFDGSICVWSCGQELSACMEACKAGVRQACLSTALREIGDAERNGDPDARDAALKKYKDCYDKASCPQDQYDACYDAYSECIEAYLPNCPM